MAHLGTPVLCDRLYAGHARATRGQLLRKQARGLPLQPEDAEVVLDRQALHAYRLDSRILSATNRLNSWHLSRRYSTNHRYSPNAGREKMKPSVYDFQARLLDGQEISLADSADRFS